MRARVFAFWLAFATASSSFAQNAAYSQFPAVSADTCATACRSDRMCASWSFGGTVPMVETTLFLFVFNISFFGGLLLLVFYILIS